MPFLAHVYWTYLFGCLEGLRPNTTVHFLLFVFPISVYRYPMKTPTGILNFSASFCVLILLTIFWISVNHSSLLLTLFLVWPSLQLAMATITLDVAELNITEASKPKHLVLPYGFGSSWAGSASGCTAGVALFHLFPIFLLCSACWPRPVVLMANPEVQGTNGNTQNLLSWASGGTWLLLHTHQ